MRLVATGKIVNLAYEVDRTINYLKLLQDSYKEQGANEFASVEALGEWAAHASNLREALQDRMRLDLGNRDGRRERRRVQRYLANIEREYGLVDDPTYSGEDAAPTSPDKPSD